LDERHFPPVVWFEKSPQIRAIRKHFTRSGFAEMSQSRLGAAMCG
jgi:hypothetical protein